MLPAPHPGTALTCSQTTKSSTCEQGHSLSTHPCEIPPPMPGSQGSMGGKEGHDVPKLLGEALETGCDL